jgi:hypothetical protein
MLAEPESLMRITPEQFQRLATKRYGPGAFSLTMPVLELELEALKERLEKNEGIEKEF